MLSQHITVICVKSGEGLTGSSSSIFAAVKEMCLISLIYALQRMAECEDKAVYPCSIAHSKGLEAHQKNQADYHLTGRYYQDSSTFNFDLKSRKSCIQLRKESRQLRVQKPHQTSSLFKNRVLSTAPG